MADIVLVDTCVLFDFMGGKDDGNVFEKILLDARVGISVITVYELLRGVRFSKHRLQREQLIGLCKVFDITLTISRKASEIYTDLKQNGRLVSNEDILIGATAIYWKHPIYTLNKKDFKRIKGIELIF